MLGSTACDCICRECSIGGVMQDFAARLQRHSRFELFLFMLSPNRELALGLLRDLPRFPDQQNGNKRSDPSDGSAL